MINKVKTSNKHIPLVSVDICVSWMCLCIIVYLCVYRTECVFCVQTRGVWKSASNYDQGRQTSCHWLANGRARPVCTQPHWNGGKHTHTHGVQTHRPIQIVLSYSNLSQNTRLTCSYTHWDSFWDKVSKVHIKVKTSCIHRVLHDTTLTSLFSAEMGVG